MPWPGMLAHESRGNPTSDARFFAGLIARMWIESASPPLSGSPGRAPLPRQRMKIGLLPVREGTASAGWAFPISRRGAGPVDPAPEPEEALALLPSENAPT